VSPILVRPVREQLEHDRIIRLLLVRLKRRHDVATNIGDEQTTGVKVGVGQMFPDLVLTSLDRGKRLEGIVEVETGESVNHLEAMAQWAHFGRVRTPFHLYVPASAVEIARRLCVENQVNVAELWSFHTIGDQTRFTLVQRSAAASSREAAAEARQAAAAETSKSAAEKVRQRPASGARAARKPARTARKAAPAARGTKARTGRAKAAPRRSARAQKRK
jgi:hypothetical protein